MPGGGKPLHLRYAVRQESADSQPTAEFITGWLKDIGIATTEKTYSDSQLTEVIGKGDYDLFVWGWTPFVDPDPMMSYFTCDQVSQDPKNPTNYYNDANWCDKTYERCTSSRRRARPGQAQADRAPDADALLRVGDVRAALLPGGPAGVPHRQVHGLDPSAGGDRAGAVQQLVADLREPQARRGDVVVAAAAAVAARATIIAIVIVAVAVLGGLGLVLRAPAERRRTRMTPA